MKNRYVHRSQITEATFRKFARHVVADLTATQIAQLTGLNRNTVNRLLRALRVRMAEACEEASPFRGEVEVDESYFGPKRVRGRRGRGVARKTPVFGVFKRNGKVHTELVPDCSKSVHRRGFKHRTEDQCTPNREPQPFLLQRSPKDRVGGVINGASSSGPRLLSVLSFISITHAKT